MAPRSGEVDDNNSLLTTSSLHIARANAAKKYSDDNGGTIADQDQHPKCNRMHRGLHRALVPCYQWDQVGIQIDVRDDDSVDLFAWA
jgi:hypothetical protein